MAILSRRSNGPSIGSLREEMRDLMGNLFENGPRGMESLSRRAPATDIYEEGEDLVLECEVPGMNRDDLELTLDNDRLTISGEHREESEEEERNYYRSERSRERFERTFAVPSSVDADQIEASFSDGILKVRLPRETEQDQQKHQVEIQ